MIRLSSAWTLVLKLFFPVFYIVFMGAWSISTIYLGDEVSPVFEHWVYRISMVILFITGVLLFRYTTWRLKRLDGSSTHFYITDYFKTFRYSFDSLYELKPISFGPFHFLRIKLKEKGSFGIKMYILIEKSVWEQYLIAHPQLFGKLLSRQ